MDWCQHHGITIHNYQGGGLDGNNSKTFLKKCNDLDQLFPGTAPPTTAAIIDLLNKFDKVVSGCFGYDLVAHYPSFWTSSKHPYGSCSESANTTLE